jgi:hypothetical protein
MKVLRNLYLQRSLSILILFVGLFSQIQTLYACGSTAAMPKQVCCCDAQDSAICPMTDTCDMHEQMAKTSCCEISYDTLNDAAMISSTSMVDTLILLLEGPQPPPIIDFQQLSPAHLPILSRLIPANDEPPISSRGKSIYLLTRRLRL